MGEIRKRDFIAAVKSFKGNYPVVADWPLDGKDEGIFGRFSSLTYYKS